MRKIVGDLTGVELEPANGPKRHPILFIHGWWGGAWIWADRFMPFFASLGYRCLAVNLRGNHGSGVVPDPGRISFADHPQDVRIVCEHLDRPIIIAHSVDGLLAQKVAEEDDLAAVVLLGPGAPRGIFALRSWALARAALQHGADMLRGRPFLPHRKAMFALNLNLLPPGEQEDVYRKMVPASGKQGMEVAILGVPIAAARVRTPMLAIVGAEDKLTPPAVVRSVAKKYGADFRPYTAHAHYIMREPGWEQVAHDIADWIKGTVPARS